MRRKLRNIYNILQSECSIIPLISIIKGDFLKTILEQFVASS